MVYVGRDLKDHLTPTPWHGWRHLPLDEAAQGPSQPCLEARSASASTSVSHLSSLVWTGRAPQWAPGAAPGLHWMFPILVLSLILLSPTLIKTKHKQSLTFVIAFFPSKCTPEGGSWALANLRPCLSTADTLGNRAYKLVVLLFSNAAEYIFEEGVG